MSEIDPKRRGPINAEYRGPGPLAYEKRTTIGTFQHCPTKSKAPAFSFGSKWRDTDDYRPGPYTYSANLTSRGSANAPAFSLQSRPRQKAAEVTPGPGSYNSHSVKYGAQSKENKSPSVIMAQRNRWPFTTEAPPPNRYTVRTGLGSKALTERFTPSWSFGGKSQIDSMQYAGVNKGVPGPGAYGSTEPNIFKPSASKYTIQGRTRVKDYQTIKDNPGPGAYEPKAYDTGRTGYTIGTRHSEYCVPLITDIDVI